MGRLPGSADGGSARRGNSRHRPAASGCAPAAPPGWRSKRPEAIHGAVGTALEQEMIATSPMRRTKGKARGRRPSRPARSRPSASAPVRARRAHRRRGCRARRRPGSGSPTVCSQLKAVLISASSARLVRSPVTATKSGFCSRMWRTRLVSPSPASVFCARDPPVEEAGDALAQQIADPHRRQRRQVDVRDVGEGDHCAA